MTVEKEVEKEEEEEVEEEPVNAPLLNSHITPFSLSFFSPLSISDSMTSLLFEISNTDRAQRVRRDSVIPDKPIAVIPFDRISKYVKLRDF
jgi:hypothetical protein